MKNCILITEAGRTIGFRIFFHVVNESILTTREDLCLIVSYCNFSKSKIYRIGQIRSGLQVPIWIKRFVYLIFDCFYIFF